MHSHLGCMNECGRDRELCHEPGTDVHIGQGHYGLQCRRYKVLRNSQTNLETSPSTRWDCLKSSHLIHVMVDGELESLPALWREPVVVDLGVKQDAQSVLLAQLDTGPESGYKSLCRVRAQLHST